jgi:hypothetical protein
MAQWNLGRGAAILVSEAGGLSQGRTEEAAACLSSGEKEQSGKGEQDGDQWLLNALGRATEGKGGRQGGGGKDAMWCRVGVGLGPDSVPVDRGLVVARGGDALCFEQERATMGR